MLVAVWLTMHCSHCGTVVIIGPEGGYVCGQCYFVVEPDGYERTRRAGLARVRAERLERQARRRAAAVGG